MHRFYFFLFIVFVSFLSAETFNAADYNAFPNDCINDRKQLQNMIDDAKKVAGSELLIPQGQYLISNPVAFKLQEDAMNGRMGKNPQDIIFKPNYKYIIGLDFRGSRNLTINAKGVELLCDGWMEPVSLRECSNIIINGLSIDYKRPANSSGKIIKSNLIYTDVEFSSWCPIKETTQFYRIMIFDEKKNSYTGSAIYQSRTKMLNPNTVRFYGLNLSKENVGRILVAWHGFHFRPGILIYESDKITLNDISIYSQPGMGIVGHQSSDIIMNRLKIIPKPGHFISSNTDATHFVSCRGMLAFNECEFQGQGDDSTNVHVYYNTINDADKEKFTLSVSRKFDTHSVLPDYPLVGDTLAVIRRSTLEEVGYIEVTAVDRSTDQWRPLVSYRGALPSDYKNYTVANISALPKLRFINCKIRSHRARSVLVKTRDVIIEGCSFENTTGTAIHIGAEGNWMEGTASADVIVRNNSFYNCGMGGSGDGTIDGASAIAIHVNAKNMTLAGLHKRILIENNEIDGAGAEHAITVKGAEDVVIRDNNISNITSDPIVIKYSRRVKVYSNEGAEDLAIGNEEPQLPTNKL